MMLSTPLLLLLVVFATTPHAFRVLQNPLLAQAISHKPIISSTPTMLSDLPPNCSDPQSYLSYGLNTKYKGIHDNVAWDRSMLTGCSFDPEIVDRPGTCGDCDIDLTTHWIRFDAGPYTVIKEYPDETQCPPRGHCNGFYQMALVAVDQDSGDDRTTLFRLLHSDKNSDSGDDRCAVVRGTYFVKKFDCDDFYLYKMFEGWRDAPHLCYSGVKRANETAQLVFTPMSFCMDDTVIPLTLTPNRKFLFDGDDVPLTCTSSRAPKPGNLKVRWFDQDGNDMTRFSVMDRNSSSSFSKVFTLNYSSFEYGMCKVSSKEHVFTRVELLAVNSTNTTEVTEGETPAANCTVIFSEFSLENEMSVVLIEVLDEKEVVYNLQNLSKRVDSAEITKKFPARYEILIPNSGNGEIWKCGVFDPITKNTTTIAIVLEKGNMGVKQQKAGNGSTFVIIGVGLAFFVVLTAMCVYVVSARRGQLTRSQEKTYSSG